MLQGGIPSAAGALETPWIIAIGPAAGIVRATSAESGYSLGFPGLADHFDITRKGELRA
jgi:hypothetical protein